MSNYFPTDKDWQKISKVLRSEEAKELILWLQSLTDGEIRTLKQTRDDVDLKRAQGRVDILELILKKREG